MSRSRPSGSLLRIQKYIYYFLFSMKFPFLLSENTPKALHYIWEVISWAAVIAPLHMTVFCSATVYKRFETADMGTLSEIGIEGAWSIFGFLILFHYKRRGRDLVELMDGVDSVFKWRSARGKTYVDLDNLYRYSKYISIFWQIVPASSVVVSVVYPLTLRPVRLPSPTWYPINQNNPFQFAIGYFLQSWSKLIVACSCASGSQFYISFCMMCCGQFNILRCSLKNLIFTSGVYKRFPETFPNNTEQEVDLGEYLFTNENRDMLPGDFATTTTSTDTFDGTLTQEEIGNYRLALKNCIEHHLEIIRICTLMEDFNNYFAFLRIIESTLQICFLAFVYVKTQDLIAATFALLTVFDIFLLTYPAEHIISQSNEVGPSLMSGHWLMVSKYFRNDFIIIFSNSMRPISFTAGKIMALNADRFQVAMTTTFSYYTLLSSIEK